MKPSPMEATALGGLAEAKAIVELVRRGHHVARPVVDTGSRLLVYRPGGRVLTVQVKSTASGRLRMPGSRNPSYSFTLYSGGGGERQVADVWLFHAHDAELWWIVPDAQLLAPSKSVCIAATRDSRGRRSALAAWLGRWSVIDELLRAGEAA